MTSFETPADLDDFVRQVKESYGKDWISRRKCSFWIATVVTLMRTRTAMGYTTMAYLLPDAPVGSATLKRYVTELLPCVASVCDTILSEIMITSKRPELISLTDMLAFGLIKVSPRVQNFPVER